jgi:N6-adenosine-specific RNA methylase IME4
LHSRGKHSVKPDAFRNDIDKLYGTEINKLEMFARKTSDGWDVWGDEV